MSCPAQYIGSVAGHLAHFDAVYARDPDPWQAAASSYEAHKRKLVGHALGGRFRAQGLEIGCGNGISSCALAPKFLHLLAVDGSSGAVALATARTAAFKNVDVEHRVLPCALAREKFDAIVASEVLYYIPQRKLGETLRALRFALRRGGLFVSTHHRRRFGDAEFDHATLVRETRSVFGHERRQHSGFGWRCYEHVRR
jgi:SAM-dependent methyltransferase